MLQPQINIDINKLETVKCPVCQHEYFDVIYKLGKLPAISSPSGQAQLIQLTFYECNNCLQVYSYNTLLNPKKLN
jgi:hypothetical protein